MKHLLLLSLTFLTLSQTLFAQSVGIGTATPDSSALLDVSSTDKGVLITRMSSSGRQDIVDPAIGLLVFDTYTETFWVFRSSGWQNLGNEYLPHDIGLQLDTCVMGEIVTAENSVSSDGTWMSFGAWQSFTSQNSGSLINVNFGSGSGGFNLIVRVYEGVGTDGPILYTLTEPDVWDGNLTIAEGQVLVEAGQKYTVGVTAPGGISQLTWPYSNSAYTDSSSLAPASYFLFSATVYNCDYTSFMSVNPDLLGFNLLNVDTIWFHDGTYLTTALRSAIADADNDTKIQVEESTDEDVIRFDLAGVEYYTMSPGGRLGILNSGNSVFIGDKAGISDDLTDNKNVFIGASAGEFGTTGRLNTGIGFQALQNCSAGTFNVGLGGGALSNNLSGEHNLASGYSALQFLTTGYYNIGVGSFAGFNMEDGSDNILIGTNAGEGVDSHTKINNVIIGSNAGQENEGDGNVFLGYNAGKYEHGSNRLYIENSDADSTEALIYGEFDSGLVRINGTLSVFDSLGIGTASPGYKLDVPSNASTDVIAHLGQAFIQNRNGTNFHMLNDALTGDNVGFGQNSGGLTTIGSSGNDMVFYTDSAATKEAMRIRNDGRAYVNYDFGFGTNDPALQLSIGTPGTGIENDGSNNLQIFNSSVETARFSSTGNLGIGTTDPKVALHVRETDTGFGWTPFSQTTAILERGGGSVLSLVSSTTGVSSIAMGDTDAQFRGRVRYEHTDDRMELWTANIERVSILGNGNVGIGVPDPTAKLQVNGTFRANHATITDTTRTALILKTDNNTKDMGLAYRNNGGNFNWNIYRSDAGGGSAHLIIAGGGQQSNIENLPERMRIMNDGRVAIGTETPASGYLLSVGGKVIAEELKIRLQNNWPDYVFDEGYQRLSLDELSDFIEVNNHLPNIPSATEVAAGEGIEVGEMQRLTIEKLEELTLYVLDLKKEIDTLKAENEAFRKAEAKAKAEEENN